MSSILSFSGEDGMAGEADVLRNEDLRKSTEGFYSNAQDSCIADSDDEHSDLSEGRGVQVSILNLKDC